MTVKSQPPRVALGSIPEVMRLGAQLTNAEDRLLAELYPYGWTAVAELCLTQYSNLRRVHSRMMEVYYREAYADATLTPETVTKVTEIARTALVD